MNNSFKFQVLARSGAARRGTLSTPCGDVQTPCFMPVGTRASVKGVMPRDLVEMGSQVILANTFHLHLRPGADLIEELGGLHTFMRYDGPILTDSGGFQVFSLADLRAISEEGVRFKSPVDGSMHFISPEVSMQIQRALGPEIVMAFDECPPFTMEDEALRHSTERTLRWLERCLTVELKPHQRLFPIVQGGMNEKLRIESAEQTLAITPDSAGYAVGGLAVGEGRGTTYRMLEISTSVLPEDRPRYLMGVGTPEDLVWAVDRGVDMFDCVLPTRNARNARVFADGGALNLRNAKFRDDPSPISSGCDCYTCQNGFSRAYLHHLHKCGEMLSGILCTLHNLRWLLRQCEEMQTALVNGIWDKYKEEFFSKNIEISRFPE